MPLSVPTVEPTAARAGDTWRWTRDLSDYPAPTWTLTYTIYSPTAVITIVGTADGTRHSIAKTAAQTAAYAAGRYEWVSHASSGSERYQVGFGVVQILPNVAVATTGYDARSHARKMLDAINAMLEGRATDGDLDVIRVANGDRVTEWDVPTLLKLRQQYASAVAAEEAAANGGRSGFAQMRF
jgi:hypothetical protein